MAYKTVSKEIRLEFVNILDSIKQTLQNVKEIDKVVIGIIALRNSQDNYTYAEILPDSINNNVFELKLKIGKMGANIIDTEKDNIIINNIVLDIQEKILTALANKNIFISFQDIRWHVERNCKAVELSINIEAV